MATSSISQTKKKRGLFSRDGLLKPIYTVVGFLVEQFLNGIDAVMLPLQRTVGIKGMAYFFVLPNLLIFGIFILFPMALNFGYAFTGGSRIFLEDRPWVGTENLETLFDCDNFLKPNTCEERDFAIAVANTVVFVVFQVGIMVGLSLVTAVALNRKLIGRGFFRSAFFYPVLLSPIVVALIWRWILQDNGVLNSILQSLGMDTISFLTERNWAKFWVIMISVWSLMGFYTLILLAGLQSIPGELYEAASIDGASQFRSFMSITLPLLMPTMLVVLVLALIRAVQVFDVVYAFTNGGPGTATKYIVQYIYDNGLRGVQQARQQGLAASASLVMAMVLVVLTLIQLRVRREDVA